MSEYYSYTEGKFQTGVGDAVEMTNPATEETVATARCNGINLEAALNHARDVGLPALQSMSFAERGEMLAKMAAVIHEHRDALIETSVLNGGTTRGGAKFDIDGASGTLAAYAAIAKDMPEGNALVDGDGIALSRGGRLQGRHLYVGRHGVAVLINAFNFPAWGFAEKAATALLGGMPVVSKPGTLTSWTAGKLTEVLVEAGVMPDGAFTQVLGSITGMLESLGPQDVVAFTGSSGTAAKIRGLGHLVANSVHVNVEADSLNAAVLGEADDECYQLFLCDVAREMTEKTGQKCTATRRLVVPEDMVERVVEDLTERLGRTKIGNPQNSDVTMGPLATAQQRDDVHGGMDRLAGVAERVLGQNRPENLIDVAAGKGFFADPSLFIARSDEAFAEVHREEVFGPVACILPYDGSAAEATRIVRAGQGTLVSSVYSDDRKLLKDVALGIAPFCGRVVVVDSKAEGHSLPTGMVLPQLIHGGPGRAGGGEELGGLRGVQHYMHRAALQGMRGMVDKITGV